jgi:hypothetical protein
VSGAMQYTLYFEKNLKKLYTLYLGMEGKLFRVLYRITGLGTVNDEVTPV